MKNIHAYKNTERSLLLFRLMMHYYLLTKKTIEAAYARTHTSKYKLEIKKDGYYDTTETVDITLGKILERDYALRQKLASCNLRYSH